LSSHYRTAQHLPLFATAPETAPCEATGASRREFLPSVAKESAKRDGKRVKILDRLRMGPARTIDLMVIGGSGFSSRLRELRDEGYRIECEQDDQGGLYTLRGEP
jgi:hypothetical protein